MRLATQVARQHDRDRSEIERLLRSSVIREIARARAAALWAWQSGESPLVAVKGLGNTLPGALAKAQTAAYLKGQVRSEITAAKAMRHDTLSLYDTAVRNLTERLLLDPQRARTIELRFGSQAVSDVGQSLRMLNDRISLAMQEAVGVHVAEGKRLIADAFNLAGFGADPHVVETTFRTGIQKAYSAARWQSNQDPDIDDMLWGYEYASTIDDGTTEICLELDGMRQPKGSAAWERYWPPNHWKCRASTIEVFHGDTLAVPTPIPSVTIPEGFGVNFGDVLQAA